MLPSLLAVFLVPHTVKCLHFWCNKGYFDHVSPGKALKKIPIYVFLFYAIFVFYEYCICVCTKICEFSSWMKTWIILSLGRFSKNSPSRLRAKCVFIWPEHALFLVKPFFICSLRLTFKRWRARAIFVPMPRAPKSHLKTQRFNLKMLVQLFQVVIHFHPGHPQMKTLTNSLVFAIVQSLWLLTQLNHYF